MPYQHLTIQQLKGLHLQPNSFAVPDGALEVAENVVIRDDYTIRKRRGFFSFNTPSSTANAMAFYKSTLFHIMSNKIASLDSAGTATDLTAVTGNVTVDTTNNKSRTAQSNGNLYLTSDNGILKIEDTSSSIYGAGVTQGLDITGKLVGSSGPIADDVQVAYRVVFGRRDSNENLLLGSPSSRLTRANSAGGSRNVSLEFSIPEEIDTTDYFYQVYRTNQSIDALTAPAEDYKLVFEQPLTSSQLTDNLVIVTDDVDDIFLNGAAELYTNPNSQEGELQANSRPPLAKDLTVFKDHVFYANTTSRHLLSFQLSTTSASIINPGDYIEVTRGTSKRYVARDGVANTRTTGTTTFVSTTVTVTSTAHSMVVGDTIFVSDSVGTGTLPAGSYTVATVPTANTFTFTAGATPTTLTALDFQGVTNAAGEYLFFLDQVSGSVSLQLANTAQGLVKAINRDGSSVVYAQYTSTLDDVPGKVTLQAKGFGDAFSLTAETATIGEAFSPNFPASGTDVSSSNDELQNNVFISKIGEPEAVPLVNFLRVGSQNGAILRIEALRDSVIVIKEDGIFRINGDFVQNFGATQLDNTVVCLASDSVAVLNNTVYCLSNQGIVQISDSSASIESRIIELPINAVLGLDLEAESHAVAYNSERLYILTTIKPNETEATTVYVYNYVTRQWSEWDTLFTDAIIGPGDAMHYTDMDGTIRKERKNQTKLDYADQDYDRTVATVSADKTQITYTGSANLPLSGDIFVKGNNIYRVDSATTDGVTTIVNFRTATTFEATDVVTQYQKYKSTIRFSPIDAGDVGRQKQFSEFQAVFRNQSASALKIFFRNEKFQGSQSIDWESEANIVSGWGNFAWGLQPWGNAELIDLQFQTLANQQARTYVPSFAARGTYLQPEIEHEQAGEEFTLQTISLAVRGYGARTTR